MGKQLNKNRFDFYQLDRRKEEKVNKKGKINEKCLIWISLVEEKEEKVKKRKNYARTIFELRSSRKKERARASMLGELRCQSSV